MTEEFASFYRDSRNEVFRAVVATTRSVVDAEEVVAEAYARAYANWSSVARHPKPQAWVVVTALNYHIRCGASFAGASGQGRGPR